MNKTFLSLLAGISAALVAGNAQSASMTSISFQGAINGTNGQPLPNGTYNLGFQFWDGQAPGGNAVSPNMVVPNVPVEGGVASTAIPVAPTWFSGQTRYLGVSVNDGQELTPRVLITAVPYSSYSQATRGIAVSASGNVGIGTMNPTSPLDVQVTSGQVLQFSQDEWAPGITVVNSMNPDPAAQGTLRLRDALEIWPSRDGSRGGRLDVRNHTGLATIQFFGDDPFEPNSGVGGLNLWDAGGVQNVSITGLGLIWAKGEISGGNFFSYGNIRAPFGDVQALSFVQTCDRNMKEDFEKADVVAKKSGGVVEIS